MISRIFIDRPIFAWVIAIVIMLTGLGAIYTLPVEQYPNIAPPNVNIRATYPGASAEVLESSVTQLIEEQLTGLDGLIYFQSTSNSAGQVLLTATFAKGTNPDIAQVQVQNKLQQALPRLPQQVQQQGLQVTKAAPDILLLVSLYDETDRHDKSDIADYLVSNLQEPVARIQGVGEAMVFGSQYAMRIWLDPFKLAAVKLMPGDVASAIQAQNAQVAAGQIGGLPSSDTQMLNALVTAQSRLTTVDQFENIILKTQSDGSAVRLQDVARVELGSENYTTVSRLNGHPAAGLAISLAPGADALATAARVKVAVAEYAKSFPPGFKYSLPADATAFIKLSIHEVVLTLLEAVVLVVAVMFIFLHSWRATLIPAIAVPVVLLGTFGILAAAGFTINTLTLFGMVLSIGLLVDDAIVVVENVERVMREEPGISPREATIKSMDQVQTALIAIALVLSAVFLPMAFFGGSVGEIYRQFSITVVSSMFLSVVVALVLSPALAATLLRRPDDHPRERNAVARFADRFGERFNSAFERGVAGYQRGVIWIIAHTRVALLVFAVMVGATAFLFLRLPTSFLPSEDQGLATLQYTLPPGATQARTMEVARQIENYMQTKEGDDLSVLYMILGQGQGGSGQNAGRGFLSLKPWDQRKGKEHTAQAIIQRANTAFRRLRDARVFMLSMAPVRGLGQSGGFTMEMLNTGGLSREDFKASVNELLTQARADPVLTAVRQNVLEDNPVLNVTTDPAKLGALGLSQAQVNQTLTAAWGGQYVNDFVDRGRVKRVYIQGDAPFRSRPEDLGNWFVRSASGEMAPFSSFAQTGWSRAPTTLVRFNGLPAYEIQGEAAAGRSTGEAMNHMSAIAASLPGISVAWAGSSYQERLSGDQAPLLYAISLTVVFLCLAALYESWSVPFAVMLVIPLGILGATLAVALRGLTNDVYFQVGLLTTMGLSAKNAILIVEFAEFAVRAGKNPFDAAVEAARMRLRPILMTSLAFIFGVLPLAVSTGPGANSRIAIGTAVIGGMLTATFLAIFYVPMFFVVVRQIFKPRRPTAAAPEAPA